MNYTSGQALSEFRERLILNFDNPETCAHEACHVLYHGRVDHDPEVFGAHWLAVRGETRWALGSVSGLPDEIVLIGPRVGVAKCYLGPWLIEGQIFPEIKNLEKSCAGDIAIFDDWFSDRYHEPDNVKQKFIAEVRSSVQQDLNQPFFREQLFWAAVEYQARVVPSAAEGNCSRV